MNNFSIVDFVLPLSMHTNEMECVRFMFILCFVVVFAHKSSTLPFWQRIQRVVHALFFLLATWKGINSATFFLLCSFLRMHFSHNCSKSLKRKKCPLIRLRSISWWMVYLIIVWIFKPNSALDWNELTLLTAGVYFESTILKNQIKPISPLCWHCQ